MKLIIIPVIAKPFPSSLFFLICFIAIIPKIIEIRGIRRLYKKTYINGLIEKGVISKLYNKSKYLLKKE